MIQNIPLGELFRISSGGTPSRKEPSYYEGGNIAWIKTGDLHNKRIFEASEYISQEGLDNSSAKLFPAGTILVAMYGATIGACSILEIEAATNQACAAFLPNGQVDTLYLYYFLKSKKNDFVRDGVGGAQPNISATYLKMVEIPLPSLATQKQIAAVLEKADQLRKDCQQMEQELNSLAQSVFIDMFGDPVTNPKSFLLKPLSDVTDRIIDCPHSTPKWTEIGVLCIRTSNLTKGNWDFSEQRFVDDKQYEERTKRSVVDSGDIVLSREGTVGIAAIVPENVKLCLGQRLVQIRVDEKYLDNEFLLFQLLFQLEPHRLEKVMSGSTVKHLNMKDIRSLNVIVPSMKDQIMFSKAIGLINKQVQDVKIQRNELDENFNALMLKAFKGELNL